MNILKTIPSYNYKPNFENFNKIIDTIKTSDKKHVYMLISEKTKPYLMIDTEIDHNFYDLESCYYSFQGMKVAIANWLDLGEVVFVNEI